MARIALVPVNAGSGGRDLSSGTAAIVTGTGNGITLPFSINYLLYVKNGAVGSLNVLILPNVDNTDSLVTPNKSVAMAASEERVFGPFPSVYRQADGNVYIESSGTGLVATAFQIN